MAAQTQYGVRVVDGQGDFAGGIDSGRPTTIASPETPQGIPRNMVAWMTNCTARGGGIRTRTGWNLIGRLHQGGALYQGGYMYEPTNGNPYLVYSVGGNIYSMDVTTGVVTDLTAAFPATLPNPASIEKAYFAQGEEFLVIQAGDGLTLPLFWDGATLRRSTGITNTAVAASTPGVNELPPATAMVYWQGRFWYAQNRTFSAGDIVYGTSGTAPYQFRDAILNVTENPLCVGGDGFAVPSKAGNIRALAYTATMDNNLGQGPLYIGTRKQIFAFTAPIKRDDWIAIDADNQPQIIVVQDRYGMCSDRSVVHSNGDLYYQTIEPGIRSLILARRDYNQFGNTPISRNMTRLLQFNDRALLHMGSGIQFDNRLWETALPETSDVGVVHKAIGILDFDLISSFQDKLAQTNFPAWEGMYEVGDVLQLYEADFGGLQRAFCAMRSSDGGIDLFEATDYAKRDYGDKRVQWIVEMPAYNWQSPFLMKELDTVKLWFDKIFGTVDVDVYFREDTNPCWHFWHTFSICAARTTAETESPEYPDRPFCEQDRLPVTLPKPPGFDCNFNKRPINLGYQFQIRLVIKGWCRLRGVRIYGLTREESPYYGMACT